MRRQLNRLRRATRHDRENKIRVCLPRTGMCTKDARNAYRRGAFSDDHNQRLFQADTALTLYRCQPQLVGRNCNKNKQLLLFFRSLCSLTRMLLVTNRSRYHSLLIFVASRGSPKGGRLYRLAVQFALFLRDLDNVFCNCSGHLFDQNFQTLLQPFAARVLSALLSVWNVVFEIRPHGYHPVGPVEGPA